MTTKTKIVIRKSTSPPASGNISNSVVQLLGGRFCYLEERMPNKVEYNKPAKSIDELIDLLEKRGLYIGDKGKAKHFLSMVNYYRLSGYWFNYQRKASAETRYPTAGLSEDQKEDYDNTFIEKVSFDNIIDIYRFDTKLRSLCLDALEKIEIACGSALCEHMCTKYGGYWFIEEEHIKDIIVERDKKDEDGKPVCDEKGKKVKEKVKVWGIDILRERFSKLIEDNRKTACIAHFNKKYNNSYPPYWIMNTLITFGLLSKIYASIKAEDKKEIADKFQIPASVLEDILISLSNIRNICAHYGRLWNRYIVTPPPDIKFNSKVFSHYNITFHNAHNFFPVFYIVAFMLKIIAPESKWCILVNELIKRYKEKTTLIAGGKSLISFEKMGFPVGWEEYPLFEDILEG